MYITYGRSTVQITWTGCIFIYILKLLSSITRDGLHDKLCAVQVVQLIVETCCENVNNETCVFCCSTTLQLLVASSRPRGLMAYMSPSSMNTAVRLYRVAQKMGPPSYLIANIPKTPWPNCMEIGGLLQYYMLNTVINFSFKNFIALWRHLAKTPLLSFIRTVHVQIDLNITL